MASNSLSESKKARRDIFLPVILADDIAVQSHTTDRSSGATFTNYGKGVAKDITVHITSFKKDTLGVRYFQTDKPYNWRFFIPEQEVSSKDFPNRINCVIEYNDIFNRKSKIIYSAKKQEFEIGDRKFWKLVFDLDNPEINLP